MSLNWGDGELRYVDTAGEVKCIACTAPAPRDMPSLTTRATVTVEVKHQQYQSVVSNRLEESLKTV